MFLKKVLNQPNLVGTVLIALMVCSGLVYAVGFDGFNVETATGSEVEAWLAAADGGSSGQSGKKACKCKFVKKNHCNCKSSNSSNNPCGNQGASGCQPKCRQDINGCKFGGKCIIEVCINSVLKGTRCTRHTDPNDYCPSRNAGKAPGRG